MAVKMEQIRVGAVFRFAKAARRVTAIREVTESGFTVDWAYADGKARAGRTGGSQWCHYFRADALEEMSPDGEGLLTLVSGRQVASTTSPVQVTLSTGCPAKWAFVDLQTADVWVHQDRGFKRASPEVLKELVAVASRATEKERL